eukprot:Rmarinus@m.3597
MKMEQPKKRTGDVTEDSIEKTSFASLLFPEPILQGLKAAGFEHPSPIQMKAIPIARSGRHLIGQSKSGTGKTCVFATVALESVLRHAHGISDPLVLIIAPSREIALQIRDVVRQLGQYVKGFACHAFIGGIEHEEDEVNLLCCQVAVGTLGRVCALVDEGLMDLSSLKLFVMDEADKMLDPTFEDDLWWLYDQMPETTQILALSATLPPESLETLKEMMIDPHVVLLSHDEPSLLGVKQYYKTVTRNQDVPARLQQELISENKMQEVFALLGSLSFHQCVVFLNHRGRAERLADELMKEGYPSVLMAGDLPQRVRNATMAAIVEFRCRVVVSTDLSSRGVDIERINLVINLDMPRDAETYLHRVGRTGRFGTYGVAVSFLDEMEAERLKAFAQQYNAPIEPLPPSISPELYERKPADKAERKMIKKFESYRRATAEAHQLSPRDTAHEAHGVPGESNGGAVQASSTLSEHAASGAPGVPIAGECAGQCSSEQKTAFATGATVRVSPIESAMASGSQGPDAKVLFDLPSRPTLRSRSSQKEHKEKMSRRSQLEQYNENEIGQGVKYLGDEEPKDGGRNVPDLARGDSAARYPATDDNWYPYYSHDNPHHYNWQYQQSDFPSYAAAPLPHRYQPRRSPYYYPSYPVSRVHHSQDDNRYLETYPHLHYPAGQYVDYYPHYYAPDRIDLDHRYDSCDHWLGRMQRIKPQGCRRAFDHNSPWIGTHEMGPAWYGYYSTRYDCGGGSGWPAETGYHRERRAYPFMPRRPHVSNRHHFPRNELEGVPREHYPSSFGAYFNGGY